MGRSVDDAPKEHLVCDLTMEPYVLVGWKEPCQFRTDDTNNVTEHGQEDETTVEGQDKTGTARRPDGPSKAIQRSQLLVSLLQRSWSKMSTERIRHT